MLTSEEYDERSESVVDALCTIPALRLHGMLFTAALLTGVLPLVYALLPTPWPLLLSCVLTALLLPALLLSSFVLLYTERDVEWPHHLVTRFVMLSLTHSPSISSWPAWSTTFSHPAPRAWVERERTRLAPGEAEVLDTLLPEFSGSLADLLLTARTV